MLKDLMHAIFNEDIEEDEEESIIIRNENNVLIEIAKHEISEIEML